MVAFGYSHYWLASSAKSQTRYSLARPKHRVNSTRTHCNSIYVSTISPGVSRTEMGQVLLDELWTDRLLFESHSTMQSILSSGVSPAIDNIQAKEVRDTFRDVHPLWEMAECKEDWYIGSVPQDEILQGITPRSAGHVRVRYGLEVPGPEAVAALIQPQIGLACLIPNVLVDHRDGDDFDATFSLRVPSSFHARFYTRYRVRRRILGHSSEKRVMIVVWDDVPQEADSQTSHFGRHLMIFEASNDDEVRMTCIIDTTAVPFHVARWARVFSYQMLYFRLGAACNLFRKRATEFYMRSPYMRDAVAESNRGRLLKTWLETRLDGTASSHAYADLLFGTGAGDEVAA